MSITEMKTAIKKLPRKEVTALANWITEYDQRLWDEQIANDVDSGKLDEILESVRRESEAGLGTPL